VFEYIDAISDSDLSMRVAEKGDSKQLLDWRNHPVARRFSGSSELIAEDNHEEWFERQLNSQEQESTIFIFAKSNSNLGMSRLDAFDISSAVVSILVDPQLHRKGIGSKILKQTIEYAFTKLGYSELRASIHIENFASIILFEKLGFVEIGKPDLFKSYSLTKTF